MVALVKHQLRHALTSKDPAGRDTDRLILDR
jgi:hypothetical protein